MLSLSLYPWLDPYSAGLGVVRVTNRLYIRGFIYSRKDMNEYRSRSWPAVLRVMRGSYKHPYHSRTADLPILLLLIVYSSKVVSWSRIVCKRGDVHRMYFSLYLLDTEIGVFLSDYVLKFLFWVCFLSTPNIESIPIIRSCPWMDPSPLAISPISFTISRLRFDVVASQDAPGGLYPGGRNQQEASGPTPIHLRYPTFSGTCLPRESRTLRSVRGQAAVREMRLLIQVFDLIRNDGPSNETLRWPI